jgi:hypothetical protein
MKRTHDLVVVTGKYTDKDNNEKSRYQKIGVLFEDDKGLKVKVDLLPVGWDGWAYLYKAEDK